MQKSDTPIHLTLSLAPATPMGDIWLAFSPLGLLAVEFGGGQAEVTQRLERHFGPTTQVTLAGPGGAAAGEQIHAYLAGDCREFTFPIDWSRLRPFQAQVLRLTLAIPYGQVRTYGEIALEAGHPGAARAVGRAEATNPMPLVIPCHRVVGSDGKLHGYGGPGGIPTKAWLLELERSKA